VKLRSQLCSIGPVCAALVFGAVASHAIASQLSFVSDTITDSRPSFPANHTVLFSVPDAVPASGEIVISFEGTPFAIDPSFSYSDMDLAYSTSSPTSGFTERPLAAAPDAVSDGVAITPLTGPIAITLSSGNGIPAGAHARLLLGTNAPMGTYQITNPSSTASYRIFINTYSVASAPIDYGAAMVVILPAVGVEVNTNRVNPPVLSNGMPSGTIPSNVLAVVASFDTDTYALCRYATTPGVSYDAMTNLTADNSVGTFHTFTVTGIAQGVTYTYYVRCVDFAGNKNQSDYVISFTAGSPTGVGSSGGTAGGAGGGGGAPYPPGPSSPSLVIHGVALPSSEILVLRDGTAVPQRTTSDGNGDFTVNIPSLAQGVYTFTLYINDGNGQRISEQTFTMTIVAGTANSVTGLVMPPSVSLATSTVAPGKKVTISGESEPSSTVEIWVTSQQGAKSPVEVTAGAGEDGRWSYAVDTTGFAVDTYEVKARSFVPGLQVSDFSGITYLGVGQEPMPKTGNPDFNGDGKVNLVDFSVLIFHWGQDWPPGDLNHDGVVDLPDLSIMLSHWTG